MYAQTHTHKRTRTRTRTRRNLLSGSKTFRHVSTEKACCLPEPVGLIVIQVPARALIRSPVKYSPPSAVCWRCEPPHLHLVHQSAFYLVHDCPSHGIPLECGARSVTRNKPQIPRTCHHGLEFSHFLQQAFELTLEGSIFFRCLLVYHYPLLCHDPVNQNLWFIWSAK